MQSPAQTTSSSGGPAGRDFFGTCQRKSLPAGLRGRGGWGRGPQESGASGVLMSWGRPAWPRNLHHHRPTAAKFPAGEIYTATARRPHSLRPSGCGGAYCKVRFAHSPKRARKNVKITKYATNVSRGDLGAEIAQYEKCVGPSAPHIFLICVAQARPPDPLRKQLLHNFYIFRFRIACGDGQLQL